MNFVFILKQVLNHHFPFVGVAELKSLEDLDDIGNCQEANSLTGKEVDNFEEVFTGKKSRPQVRDDFLLRGFLENRDDFADGTFRFFKGIVLLIDVLVSVFKAVEEDKAIFGVIKLFKEEVDVIVDEILIVFFDEEFEVFFGELFFGKAEEVSNESFKFKVFIFELFL